MENNKTNISDNKDSTNQKVQQQTQQQTLESQFRLLPINMIDSMIDLIYESNKKAFDLYFELNKAKAMNKIQVTPKKQEDSNDKS